MCGRFEIHSAIEIIARLFQIDGIFFDLLPNYNIAPGQEITLVVNDGKKNRLASGLWGFVPSWAREPKPGYVTINARAETVATGAAFKEAFRSGRCLVPADGFFEWKKEGSRKTPLYVRLKSGLPMAFAGLYSVRASPDGGETRTAAIITTDANELVAPIHSRMPAILPEGAYERWLDPAERKEELLALLKPFPSGALEQYAVTERVNSYKNNDPGNIRPVGATGEPGPEGGL